ncbi:MAG: nuclear transport factor 2 family protein [Bacteriovoracaceae bacterium]|nr:nuclear transport factor 2 family protein [Bacteriovoracaceae bacterium]
MSFILALLLVLATNFAHAQEKVMNYAERARDAFTRLDATHLNVVEEFYDKNIEFHDPIGTIRGRDKIRAYYEKMYKDLKSIKFEYHEAISHDKTVVLVWKMTYATTKLNGGEPISIEGNSVIKFGGAEDKVVYHRDYFDIGAMVYEYIPVLGWGVKTIREKLGEH